MSLPSVYIFSFSETFTRAAAFADDFDFLGVACAVVADQLETALLGAARSTTVGTAVAAAHGIPHRFRRPAAVLHVIVAVLLLAASGRCQNQKTKFRYFKENGGKRGSADRTGIAEFSAPSGLTLARVRLAVFFGDALTFAAAAVLARIVRRHHR